MFSLSPLNNSFLQNYLPQLTGNNSQLQQYNVTNPTTTAKPAIQEDVVYLTAISQPSVSTTSTTGETTQQIAIDPQIMSMLLPIFMSGGLQQQMIPQNNIFSWENISATNLMGQSFPYQEYNIPTMMPFGLTATQYNYPQMQYLPFNITHTEYPQPEYCLPPQPPEPKVSTVNNINTNNLDNYNNNSHIRDGSGNSSLLDFDLDLF